MVSVRCRHCEHECTRTPDGLCPACGAELTPLGQAATVVNPSRTRESTTDPWQLDIDATATIHSSLGNRSRSALTKVTERLPPRNLAGDPGGPGDYDLLEPIGHGGMGVVFSARQHGLDREVAVKLIREDQAADEHHQDGFVAEAMVTGALDHPGIVPVYDLGRGDDGTLFYAMKRIEGQPWSQRIAHLGLDRNLDILERVCEAVAFAHDRGVIHRDLKPDNVMLGAYGEVLLVDWGLSVGCRPDSRAEPLGRSNAGAGTPAYMAPEMARRDNAAIGIASDIYLLGAILFEIRTGTPPHSGESVLDCIDNARDNLIVDHDPDDPLLTVALEAMATDPAQRPRDALTFRDATRQWRQHSVSIRQARSAQRTLEEAQRHGDYTRFTQAIFGFAAALETWPTNPEAIHGHATATRAYAALAIEHGDLDLADSLLPRDDHGFHDLVERLERARSDRRRRHTWHLIWRATAGALVATLFVVISVAYLRVSQARGETQEALEEVSRERDVARAERRRAKRAEADALAAADRTDRLNDFMVQMLTRPSPWDMGHDVPMTEVVDAAREDIGDRFDDDPLLRADIQHNLAVTYLSLARYDRAEPLLRAAWDARREHLPPHHADRIESLRHWCDLLFERGRHAEGLALLESTIEERGDRLAPDLLTTLRIDHVERLAGSGDARAALEAIADLLGDAEALDREHEIRLRTTRANALSILGDYQAALDEVEAVLAGGVDDIHRRWRLELQRAMIINVLRHDGSALELVEDLVAQATERYGPEHQGTMYLRRHLAYLHHLHGHYQEVLEEMEPVHRWATEHLPLHHRFAVDSATLYAASLRQTGQAAQAMTVLEPFAGLVEPDSPLPERHRIELRTNLARTHLALGELDRAEAMFRSNIEATTALIGADSAAVHQGWMDVGTVLTRQGRHAEAAEALARAVRGRLELNGPANPATILTRTHYAFALQRSGQLAAAIAELEAALEHATTDNTNARWREEVPLILTRWRMERGAQPAAPEPAPQDDAAGDEAAGFELFD